MSATNGQARGAWTYTKPKKPNVAPGEPAAPDVYYTALVAHCRELAGCVLTGSVAASLLHFIGSSIKTESTQSVRQLVVIACALLAASHGMPLPPPDRKTRDRLDALRRVLRPVGGELKWAEVVEAEDDDTLAIESFHLDKRDLGDLWSLVALGHDIEISGASRTYPGHRLRVTVA